MMVMMMAEAANRLTSPSLTSPSLASPGQTSQGLTSLARVATTSPSRYLGQLCKHFAHKLPTTHDAETGRIEFPFGLCELAAGKDILALTVSAADADALTRMEEVIGSHLIRFAFREPLEVNWQRDAD
jgi:hypothetical protein